MEENLLSLYKQHRRDYPNVIYESRALPPVDGVTRVLTLSKWYWDCLEDYIENTTSNLESVTRFCLNFSKDVSEADNLDFDHTFCNAFMYYIYGGYYRLVQSRNNIANDFWKPIRHREQL